MTTKKKYKEWRYSSPFPENTHENKLDEKLSSKFPDIITLKKRKFN